MLKSKQKYKVSVKQSKKNYIEKVSFHEKWRETLHRCRKNDLVGEQFVIR